MYYDTQTQEDTKWTSVIRDGSEGGEIVDGYWTNQVVASDVDSNEITPLYLSLYSQNSPNFTNENDEILKAIDQVGKAVQNRGIWVINRGGDRDALFEPLLQKQRDFIISMVGTREEYCEDNQRQSQFNLRYAFVPLQLPDMEAPLNIVVVKGFGVKFIIQAYIKRWSVEETIYE